MATAKLHDGRAIVAYVNGEAVDSNGVEIEGAPKQPKDTDPSNSRTRWLASQHRRAVCAILATAFASALQGRREDRQGSGGRKRPGREDRHWHERQYRCRRVADDQGSAGPRCGLKTVAEVKAMQKRDDRVSAEPIYKARLAELKEEK
jgi:hypothetical protein